MVPSWTSQVAVPVASVTNRAGESLYSVSGVFVGGGGKGGGPAATWAAQYNKGAARVVLTLNPGKITFDRCARKRRGARAEREGAGIGSAGIGGDKVRPQVERLVECLGVHADP